MLNTEQDFNWAIAACVKQPVNFKFWLDYHLNQCGVSKIFLRIQDTPELQDLIDLYSQEVEAVFVDSGKSYANDYYKLQNFQIDFVNGIVNKLKADNPLSYTHLIHIDDDELIYFPSGPEAFWDELQAFPGFGCYSIQNIEACYERPFNNLFTAQYFCIESTEYVAYANGKSIASLNENVELLGPHRFSGKQHDLDPGNIVILHYESHDFDNWFQKFKAYSINNALDVDEIPFEFFRQSIEVMSKSRQAQQGVWDRYKLLKYKNIDNIVEIDLDNF